MDSRPPPRETPRTYRAGRQVLSVATLIGVAGVVGGGIGVLGTSPPVGIAVTFGLVAVVVVFVVVVAVRARTVCGEDGLLVVTGWSSRIVAWPDVVDVRAELLSGVDPSGQMAAVVYAATGSGDVDVRRLPGVTEKALGGRESLRGEVAFLREVWLRLRGPGWAGEQIDVRAARIAAVDRSARQQKRVYLRALVGFTVGIIAFAGLLALLT